MRRRFRFVEETTEQTPEPANPPEREPVFDQDRVTILRSAMNGLPGEQRRAIEMEFFGGMTQNEISETLQQPPGTIKARIRRGMLKLRDSPEGRL